MPACNGPFVQRQDTVFANSVMRVRIPQGPRGRKKNSEFSPEYPLARLRGNDRKRDSSTNSE